MLGPRPAFLNVVDASFRQVSVGRLVTCLFEAACKNFDFLPVQWVALLKVGGQNLLHRLCFCRFRCPGRVCEKVLLDEGDGIGSSFSWICPLYGGSDRRFAFLLQERHIVLDRQILSFPSFPFFFGRSVNPSCSWGRQWWWEFWWSFEAPRNLLVLMRYRPWRSEPSCRCCK